MPTTNRIEKVNSLLSQEIGKIILRDFDFSDCLVTLTHADTTPNLIDTRIYISVMPENKIENIEFNRCSFIIPITFNSQIYNNISFKNCLFNSSINLGSSTFNNLVITNCIFTYPNDVQIISGNNVNGQVFIRNCIFMNNTTNGFNAAGLVVENSV